MATERETPKAMRRVPPLPRGLANPVPIVLTGTVGWLVVLITMSVQVWLGGELGVWFWTSMIGFVLGIAGYGVYRWQSWASGRGARGSWRGSGLGE